MGITFKEVEENSLISQEVLDYIPRECECGAPIEFTDTLRQIYCSNTRCIYKIASRLETMAKAMKADGFGASTCITLCKEFKLISPYQVFLLPKMIESGRTSTVAAFEKKVENICDMEKRKVKLWEVVKLAGIPSIKTIAYKIFNGYDTISEAFNDIERGQVPFIAEKLGLKNSENSVMAVNVYNTLIQYKEELLFGEQQFNIIKPEGLPLHIAITGGVYGFRNKSEFVKYINNRFSGKVNAMLMNSVTSDVDILVVDGDTSHHKFSAAVNINNKYLTKAIENGEIKQDDIGKFINSTDLHPVGEKILIGNSTEVIERLDKIFG